jgi:hypothetical protein
MKSPTVPWIVAAFALGCAAATTAQQGMTAARQAENNQAAYNAHGAEGWELVGEAAPGTICFKRPG